MREIIASISDGTRQIDIQLQIEDDRLFITPRGYDHDFRADRNKSGFGGNPVFLEIKDGRLQLVVYTSNKDHPNHPISVDMEALRVPIIRDKDDLSSLPHLEDVMGPKVPPKQTCTG